MARPSGRPALAQHPGVVGTHHIGASTEQAQLATAAGVVEIVDAFTEGEARNCVNLAPSRLGSVTLTIRHLDRPGVLARVLDLLSEARLNVEHMVNRVFRGGEAAIASIDVAGSLPDELLDQIGARPDVLGVSATPFAGVDDDRTSYDRCTPGWCRQEHAARNVSQMLDALPVAERTRQPGAVPADLPALRPRGVRRVRARALRLPAATRDQEHVGVVGDVRVEAFVDGQVRGHEAVQPDRVAGLVEHFASVAVRSELVALLHESGPAVEAAVAETLRTTPLISLHRTGRAGSRRSGGCRRP